MIKAFNTILETFNTIGKDILSLKKFSVFFLIDKSKVVEINDSLSINYLSFDKYNFETNSKFLSVEKEKLEGVIPNSMGLLFCSITLQYNENLSDCYLALIKNGIIVQRIKIQSSLGVISFSDFMINVDKNDLIGFGFYSETKGSSIQIESAHCLFQFNKI